MDIDPISARGARARAAAEKAEREANDRIQKANQKVKQAEVEAQAQIEEQRDRFERRYQGESAVAEGRLEDMKSKNYEQLRKMKHQSDIESQRIKRTVEAESAKLRENYEQINEQIAREGEKKFRDTTIKNHQLISAEQRKAMDQLDTVRALNTQTLLNLQNEKEIALNQLTNEAQKKHKALEEKTIVAAEQDQLAYADKYESAVKGHRNALQTVESDAKAHLDAKKLAYQRRIDAYSNSRSDPFYQPVTINAQMSDNDDHFVITANIPANEQNQVSITMKGDTELVIAGHRRAEEKIEKDGHTRTTSSYQTYSESIPLNWPVDPKGMTREWDGDRIIVRLPKQTFDASAPKRPKRTIANARMERPQFPKDLPTESQLAKASDPNVNEITVANPQKKPSKRVFSDS